MVQNDVNTIAITPLIVTEARTQLVDMAQYFRVGNGFLVKSTYGGTINNLNDLCGKKVATLAGSTTAGDLQAQKALCPSSSPLTIVPVPTRTELPNSVLNGQADVAVTSQLYLLTFARDSNNQLKVVGMPYNVRPY
ncbi:unnamed protein product, partial [Rotaria sordida]